MVTITGVLPGSFADRAGIKTDDCLISVNGREIRDVLDYRFFLAETTVVLQIHRGPELFDVTIRKGMYDDIGLEFETPLMDKKHSCENKCIFCFIDQLPKGLRKSLYFKDDDSRLSFLHGNYITLTNLKQRDVDRIIEMHISPVNVSVHTTNPELRVMMMKNKRAGEVLDYIRQFAEAGIKLRGQIVLCRGVNDGAELDRTMRDLAQYYPALESVSIVPAKSAVGIPWESATENSMTGFSTFVSNRLPCCAANTGTANKRHKAAASSKLRICLFILLSSLLLFVACKYHQKGYHRNSNQNNRHQHHHINGGDLIFHLDIHRQVTALGVGADAPNQQAVGVDTVGGAGN